MEKAFKKQHHLKAILQIAHSWKACQNMGKWQHWSIHQHSLLKHKMLLK